jgi:hypothetical protein
MPEPVRSPEGAGLPWPAAAALALAVGATLAVAAALLLFAHPMGDDFCNAVSVRELGLLGAVRHEYLEWGGRWAGHVVVVGFPALLDPTRSYALGLSAVVAAAVVAFRFLIGSLLPLATPADRRLGWALALALYALHFAGMPHPGQTVYWFEGAAVYSLNVSLALLLLGCLLRLSRQPGRGRAAAEVGLALGALTVAAFQELVGMILLGVLVLGAGACRLLRDGRGRAWALAALGALLGLLSVALAPGNAVRSPTLNPDGGSLPAALAASAAMWLRVLDAPGREAVGELSPLGWPTDPKLLAASVLVALLPRLRRLRPAWLDRAPRAWRWSFPAVLALSLTGSFLAGGWALGRTLPLRAFNALHVVFLLGWFLTLVAWTWDGEEEAATGSRARRALCTGSALALALALLVSPHVKLGLRDLLGGHARAFDRVMERRYAEARRARAEGARELRLAPIVEWPSTYFQHDVGQIAPALEACVADYFGVDAVRLAAAPE